MRCGNQLAPTSTGDHIIPLVEGGAPGIENYAPLCQPCNSSKHKRDLLEWWQAKGHSFLQLPLDVLTAYARLHFDRAQQRGLLQEPTPPATAAMVVELSAALPSDAHRYQLWQRVQYVTGRAWHMPDAPQRRTAAAVAPARPS
jgi:HNH endonuclease